MVRHSSPLVGRYSRYVIIWLLFGMLGPVVLWQASVIYSSISLLFAVILTFGYDFVTKQIAIKKVKGFVNQEIELIEHAVKYGSGRKGFIVITKEFVIFVPMLKKIKTIMNTNQVVRHERDGEEIEITVRFPNKYRNFQFFVSSPSKVKKMLQEKSGESLPYKYEKFRKNESV